MSAALTASHITLRFRGRVDALDAPGRQALFNRSASRDSKVVDAVRGIIDRVRKEGDAALFDLARIYDGVTLEQLEVSARVIRNAADRISPELRAALARSACNIERVHTASFPVAVTVEPEAGVVITRRPDALDRVGIYAPGGKAAYASSVLMAAVPARVAGVNDVILCSPPTQSGAPAIEVLAAASIAGVERVFAIGGAGAIASMALGTESVPRVAKVVGPGNAFVSEAKIQLTSEVAIDSPAGPSELLVIADDAADPDVIAREMLAQAEHDARAVVVVLAIGDAIAASIESALAAAVGVQSRCAIITEALQNEGGVLVVDDISEAIQAATEFAPEHLLIVTRDAGNVADRVRAAGSVFIGETASVAFGDYITGANHVLPTGGMARAYSGLSTLDFIRWTTTQRVSREAAGSFAADTAAFAEAEGLPGHAAAARAWGRSR